MKRAFLFLAMALLVSSMAMAGEIKFYTTGSFSGGTGTIVNYAGAPGPFTGPSDAISTDTFTSGASTTVLKLLGDANSTTPDDEFTPTTVALGEFQVSSTCFFPSCTNPVSGTFSLNIFEIMPGSASGSLVSTLEGNLEQNTSTGEIDYSDLSSTVLNLTAGGSTTTYTLELSSHGCTHSPCSTIVAGNGDLGTGVTTLQADVTTVPEPGSLALFGTGLAGMAGVIRRRLRK